MEMRLAIILLLCTTGGVLSDETVEDDLGPVEHVNATVIEDDLTKSRPPVDPTPEEIAQRKHQIEMLQR